jgi:hypothetical protein
MAGGRPYVRMRFPACPAGTFVYLEHRIKAKLIQIANYDLVALGPRHLQVGIDD